MARLRKETHLFRDKAACPSWRIRNDREEVKTWLSSLRTDAQIRDNKTLGRDLTEEELAQYRLFSKNSILRNKARRPGNKNFVTRQIQALGATEIIEESSEKSSAVQIAASDAELDWYETAQEKQSLNTDLEESEDPGTGEEEHEDIIDHGEADDDGFSSDLEDPYDSRNDVPSTTQEIATLNRSLSVTRMYFESLTGQAPAATNERENYASQWSCLQMQLDTLRQTRNNSETRPVLPSQEKWTGGILKLNDQWT